MKRAVLFLMIICLLIPDAMLAKASCENNEMCSLAAEELPAADYNVLYPDSTIRATAEALRMYYMDSFAYRSELFDDIWNHRRIILSDPYVLKTENMEDGSVMIYCFSTINSYSICKQSDGTNSLNSMDEIIGAFRINIFFFSSDNYEIESVYQIGDYNEELYSGAGTGVEGIPGLSEIIINQIGDKGFATNIVAQEYLDMNNVVAEINY